MKLRLKCRPLYCGPYSELVGSSYSPTPPPPPLSPSKGVRYVPKGGGDVRGRCGVWVVAFGLLWGTQTVSVFLLGAPSRARSPLESVAPVLSKLEVQPSS